MFGRLAWWLLGVTGRDDRADQESRGAAGRRPVDKGTVDTELPFMQSGLRTQAGLAVTTIRDYGVPAGFLTGVTCSVRGRMAAVLASGITPQRQKTRYGSGWIYEYTARFPADFPSIGHAVSGAYAVTWQADNPNTPGVKRTLFTQAFQYGSGDAQQRAFMDSSIRVDFGD